MNAINGLTSESNLSVKSTVVSKANVVSKTSADSATKVAIVGLACRFPGGSNTPELFFENLLSGENFVSEIPADRWAVDKFFNERDVAGKAYVRHGHFLQDYDYRSFDAEFFNFSPREVEFLDPQQRLLLELSWEAMESAGLDPEALAGSDTGVFIGGFTVDHLLNQFGIGARDNIGMHSAAGSTLTMLANRISYAFDFRGPSFSLDTACSSSLVAFAQAVNAVRSGQCEIALAGGANIILRPEYTVAMSKGRFLAKDGRSKSFDARADGYGRGEGGGIVVVKNYAAALRDGDRILAIVDGVGVNQDGRTSGITVPNPDAQRQLMRQVLDDIGCAASDVDYVEAHGTGTAVGDPLETRAIADVYGEQGHCVVGSVKASIGHLEAAAGIASVIKSVLMLRHNIVPPVAGLEEINPAIPAAVQLPRAPLPLSMDENKASKIAINSFGYGGTNAHAVLSKAPSFENKTESIENGKEIDIAPATSARLLPISARSVEALNIRAQQFADALKASDDKTFNDILFTAAHRAPHMTHRLAVWGQNRDELIANLQNFADGKESAWLSGRRIGAQPRVAFVYTGMGPQWHAMGCELFAENKIFRETLQAADEIFQRIAGFSILEQMFRDEADSQIKHTEFAQPANLLIQMGLTAALKAEGIEPFAVVGHSVGEVASAWASGMLTLEEALLVSRERSRAQGTTAGMGSMLALGVSGDDAKELIAPHGDAVSIAALNSPRSVTVAGDTAAIDAILEAATARNIFARKLDVAVPYHSPVMERLKPELREKLSSLQPRTPTTPLYSTVTGDIHEKTARFFDAEYWCDNVREPVYFAAAIRSMLRDGIDIFIEVGPHPVLRRAIEEVIAEQNAEARIASTLWMNKPETPALQRAVAEIFVHGGAVNWAQRQPAGNMFELPAYPWQRKTLWREALWQARDRLDVQHAPLNAPAPGADLNLRRLNYLFDHVVDGAPIMPAAGFLEALCEEAQRHWPQTDEDKGWGLRDVKIREALVLDSERPLKLDMRFNELTRATEVTVHETGSDKTAVVHAEAVLYACNRIDAVIERDIAASADIETLDREALYAAFHAAGLQYGPAFQPIRSLRRNNKRGEAMAVLQRATDAGENCSEYVLHPSLLDGCFQTALTLLDLKKDGAFLPVSLRALEVYAPTTETIICRTRIVKRDTSQVICDFEIADENGALLARIKELRCVAMRGEAKQENYPLGDYQREWIELPQTVEAPQAIRRDSVALIAERADRLADALIEVCRNAGVDVTRHAWSELRETAQAIDAGRVICLAYAGRGKTADPTGEDQMIDLLHLAQMLHRQNRPLALRVITRNAAAVIAGDIVAPAQAAVAGFTRVVRNELSALDAAVIDLVEIDNRTDKNAARTNEIVYSQAEALFAEINRTDAIDEIALRDTRRFGVELVQSGALQQAQIAEVSCSDDDVIELIESAKQTVARVQHSQPLADDAYEIRVERLGVNKQYDAMGFSGTIVRAGSDAHDFTLGERVFGLAPKRIASKIIVTRDAAIIHRAAENHSISGLAAVVDARAEMIVNACALARNSSVLIGSGVLGDALSRRFENSDVNVTRIGNDLSRWQFAFHDGEFDAIAAPLARWSKEAGFSALKAGGQLIEIDNDNTPFALPAHCGSFIRIGCAVSALQKDTRYIAALERIGGERIIETRSIGFADLLAGAANSMDINSTTNDWIDINVAGDTRKFSAFTSDLPALQRDATYLITGGFGGLGSEVARWLARAGAGHIALVGRRGASTLEALALLDELRSLGATPSVHALDINDSAAVHTLIQMLDMQLPLRGIFHAAGVLDDQLVGDMTAEQISKVMRTKAGGALALHEALTLCRVRPDYFVLFSSIANLVGNSRQANYCAANGFLDGLAHYRRALGLPALSINFGAIAGVGMLDGDARVGQHLAQIGLTPLDVNIALAGVGRAMVQEQTQIAVSEQIAWEKWAAYEPIGGASPAFRKLVDASRAQSAGDASLVEQLHAALAAMDAAEARGVVRELIAEVIATALKTTADRLTHDDPFDTFGVDSLMSTEIQIQLDRAIGVSYSVVELLGHATINKLADKAIAEITATAAARAA